MAHFLTLFHRSSILRALSRLWLIGSLALAGVLAVSYATRAGIGLSPDSTIYLDTARSLQRGQGLQAYDYRRGVSVPLAHFPPLVPALFALAGLPERDPMAGARRANALLFGASIFLIGWSGMRQGSPGGLLAALLAVLSPDLLYVHSMLWSEPLFLCVSLLAMLFLAQYLERPRISTLLTAATFVALACLTRYIGVALIMAGGATILWLGADPSKRLRDAAIFSLLAALPLSLWLLHNALLTGLPVDRALAAHPRMMAHLVRGISTISSWAAAGKLRMTEPWAWVFLAELAAAAVLVVGLRKRRSSLREIWARDPRVRVGTVFVACYLLTLLVNASFFESTAELDERALTPIHLAVLWILPAFIPGIQVRSPVEGSTRARWALVALCALAAFAHLTRGITWVVERSRDGAELSSRVWTQSPTMALVQTFAAEIPVFSNTPEAVYALTGRPAWSLPAKVHLDTGRPNRDFPLEIDRMRQQIERGDGVIVLFDATRQPALPNEQELKAVLPLRLLVRCPDGAVYRLAD